MPEGQNTTGEGQEPAAGATGQGQASTGGQQQNNTGGQGQEPAAGTGEGQEPSPLEQRMAAMERELAEARREAANYRTQLRTREQEGMTEQERLAAERADLERERNELREQLETNALTSSAAAVAERLGFRNPRLAVDLLPRDRSQLMADGKPNEKALEDALKARLAADPYLAAGGGDDAGGGRRTGGSRGRSMNELIRGQAARS